MFIYLITNTVNRKYYVGQEVGAAGGRFIDHKKDARKGCTYYLHNAIRKYGEENFKLEILCPCPTREALNISEKFFIKWMGANKSSFGYNMTDGGQPEIMFSGEQRERVNKMISKKRLELCSTLSKEGLQALTAPSRARVQELRALGLKMGGPKAGEPQGPHLEITKQRIGDANRGKPGHWNKGRQDQPHKEESKVLMSEKIQASWDNPSEARIAQREKMRNGDLGRKAVWSLERRAAQGERLRQRNLAGLAGRQVKKLAGISA